MAFYSPSSLAKDGFIHASTREQILPTANRRFEFSPGSGEKHPHIYGSLSLHAICGISSLTLDKI